MSIEVYYINAFSERTVTYDRNGNILSLTRYGADTAVPEEALAYSYDGDLLSGVSNSGSSGGGGSYTHDANGNLTRDGLSGLDIEYDDLNLTSRVSSGDTTLAEKYYAVSPYAYCSANPVNIVDPNGLAWKPLYYNGEYVGYEWISNDDAYENGHLKDGYYEQAIFFTATGTQGSFDKDSKYNIGTSTAFVYLADGSIMAYNASTYPADLDKFPTVPEGLYEAKVGKHKGSYDALRLSEIGTENFYANRIDLDNENPAFSDGRTYAQGINIHKAGKGDLTGGKNTGIYVSQGCLLISRTEWSSFIGHFANKSQRNNIVSVSVSRSVSTPVKYLLPPPIHISIKR